MNDAHVYLMYNVSHAELHAPPRQKCSRAECFNRHTGMVRTEPGNNLGMRQPLAVLLALIV